MPQTDLDADDAGGLVPDLRHRDNRVVIDPDYGMPPLAQGSAAAPTDPSLNETGTAAGTAANVMPGQNPQTLNNGGASGTLSDEVTFISGLNPDGTLAFYSFAAWNNDTPSQGGPTYTGGYTLAMKWFADSSANTAGTPGGTVYYYFDPSSNWSATEEQVFIDGYALWSAEANISFVETSDPSAAQVTITRSHDGGANTDPDPVQPFPNNAGLTNGTVLLQFASATISIDTRVAGFGPLGSSPTANYGGYPWMTVLHEEGHTLGLGHAGPYNGTNATSQQFSPYDTRLWSLMSYFNNSTGGTNPPQYALTNTTSWNGYYPTTPMIADILAAQRLYGMPTSTPLSGGQVFGFHTNITGNLEPFFDFTINTTPIITLWDEGSNNTLDISGFSQGATVNLNPGTFSSIGGLTNNLGIAFGTAIDTFIGGAAADTVTANNDGDTIYGGAGNDTLTGGTGDDTLDGGGGNDTLDGGAGTNTAVFSGARASYTITPSGKSLIVSGPDGTDTLSNIEFLKFDDQTIAAPAPPAVTTPYDYNGDGRSDILWHNTVTGANEQWQMNGATISNDASLPLVATSWSVAGVGDFGGDGKSDLLWHNNVTGADEMWQMNGLSIATDTSLPAVAVSWSVAKIGDFNGDGKSDILWHNTVTGANEMWQMNGSTITTDSSLPLVSTNWVLAGTGDFNGDGKSDILWHNNVTGANEMWLMNGSTITTDSSLPAVANGWSLGGIGDFNGDGKSDILWRNPVTGAVEMWQMNGATIANDSSLPAVATSWSVAETGDFGGDGKADILWHNNITGANEMWQMSGSTISTDSSLPAVASGWMAADSTVPHAANDFNGDGKSDILWHNTVTGANEMWQMNGSTISNDSSLPAVATGWATVQTGDFNSDGKSDILWRNTSTGAVEMWQMNGSTISNDFSLPAVATGWSVVQTGDFNGDGKSDILWHNTTTGANEMWQMNGSAIATDYSLPAVATAWTLAGIGDFNGDGRSDILWHNGATGAVEMWQMNGSTITSDSSLPAVASGWTVAGIGDFDGDGKSDILWHNTTTGANEMWQMNGSAIASDTSLPVVAAGWTMAQIGDFNGDGKADILWRNTSTGAVEMWQMNGATIVSDTSLPAVALAWTAQPVLAVAS